MIRLLLRHIVSKGLSALLLAAAASVIAPGLVGAQDTRPDHLRKPETLERKGIRMERTVDGVGKYRVGSDRDAKGYRRVDPQPAGPALQFNKNPAVIRKDAPAFQRKAGDEVTPKRAQRIIDTTSPLTDDDSEPKNAAGRPGFPRDRDGGSDEAHDMDTRSGAHCFIGAASGL